MQTEAIKEMVQNVTQVKHAMLGETPEMERGWVLRNGSGEFVIFGESEVTITPYKHKASFYPDYAEAIVQAKTRGGNMNLRLVAAERIKK